MKRLSGAISPSGSHTCHRRIAAGFAVPLVPAQQAWMRVETPFSPITGSDPERRMDLFVSGGSNRFATSRTSHADSKSKATSSAGFPIRDRGYCQTAFIEIAVTARLFGVLE